MLAQHSIVFFSRDSQRGIMVSENNQIEIIFPLSRNRQDLYLSDIRDLVAKYKCVRTGCEHFVRTLSDTERRRLIALVKETKFSRR